jgi:hypothetical protein
VTGEKCPAVTLHESQLGWRIEVPSLKPGGNNSLRVRTANMAHACNPSY